MEKFDGRAGISIDAALLLSLHRKNVWHSGNRRKKILIITERRYLYEE